jgi:hypothetical protein
VRSHHNAVASYDKKIAAAFAALRQELLLSVAVVIELSEIRQPVSASASND